MKNQLLVFLTALYSCCLAQVTTVVLEPAAVKDDFGGNYLETLQPGDTVLILDWKWYDVLVQYNGKKGYISQSYVKKDGVVLDSIKAIEARARKRIDAQRDKEAKEFRIEQERKLAEKKRQRVTYLKSKFGKYGSSVVSKIAEQKIWIGMTSEMALESWGAPDRINKTVTYSFVKEQWVYEDQYLYFKNGVLESYQTTD